MMARIIAGIVFLVCAVLIIVLFSIFFAWLSLPAISWHITGVMLFSLNVLDVVSTRIALRRGGKERNPLFAFLMAKLGFVKSAILKLAIIIAILLLWWQDTPPSVQYSILLSFSLVIVWNFIPKRKVNNEKITGPA